MFLSFSFCPGWFCSHQQQWSSPCPGLNSISHYVGSWHLADMETFWALPRLLSVPEEGLLSAESMRPVSNSAPLPILYCCMCLRKWKYSLINTGVWSISRCCHCMLQVGAIYMETQNGCNRYLYCFGHKFWAIKVQKKKASLYGNEVAKVKTSGVAKFGCSYKTTAVLELRVEIFQVTSAKRSLHELPFQ